MAENWNCPHCTALNPPRKRVCWQCGWDHSQASRSPQPDRPQADQAPLLVRLSRSWQANKGAWIAGGLSLLLAAVLAWSLVQYVLDSVDYTRGIAAYRGADCSRALRHFDRLDDRRRIWTIGPYLSLARQPQVECEHYQRAVESRQAGNPGGALIRYSAFVDRHQESILVAAARAQTWGLFMQVPADKLASTDACPRVDTFLAQDLVPDHETYLPPFFLACGQVYDAALDRRSSFSIYKRLLASYPAHPVAPQAIAALLDNPVACQEAGVLREQGTLDHLPDLLPTLYRDCGQAYDAEGDAALAWATYTALLTWYPEHALAQEVASTLLAHELACEKADELQDNEVIAGRTDFLPTLYRDCGQAYDAQGEYAASWRLYRAFWTHYPAHPLIADVERALFEHPLACERPGALQASALGERADFMPTLYYRCGQAYQADGDHGDAIEMFEWFRAEYPDHPLAPEVEAGLAHSIVEQAKQANAAEMPDLESSGWVQGNSAVVVIRNDSPERLRITLRGPETRIEELDACSSCERYNLVGPLTCPGKGPVGRYTFEPGAYDVVVEAIGERGVTPFTGHWTLNRSRQYSNCFYIVTRLGL